MSERDGLFLHVNQDHNENTEYSSINVLEQRRPTYIENNSKKTQVPFFGPVTRNLTSTIQQTDLALNLDPSYFASVVVGVAVFGTILSVCPNCVNNDYR